MKKRKQVVACLIGVLLTVGCEKNELPNNASTPSATKQQEVVQVKTNVVLSDVKSETATILRIRDNVYLWDEHWKIEEDCNEDELSYQSHFLNMPRIEKIEIEKSNEIIEKPNTQKIEAQGYQRLSTKLFEKDNLLMYRIPTTGVYGCPLTREGKVTVPKGTKAIFDSAFWSCDKITSVFLTNSVKWVGNGAFGKMSSCKRIEVEKKNPYIEEKDGVLYMKDGKVLIAYPAGKNDKTFIIPKGTKYIADGAFAGAKNLEQVVLSSSVEYIGYQAFDGCSNLKVVRNVGEEQYKFVASTAFQNCERLRERIQKTYDDEDYIKNWHGLYKFLDDIEEYMEQ